MADKLHLQVLTPERKLFEAEVDQVEIPALNGALGVLPGHTELVSQLKAAGLLTYTIGDQKGELVISDGFVEIGGNKVIVLAHDATKPEDIDLAHALELKDSATARLLRAQSDPDVDVARATIELERALIELHIAQKSRT